MLGSTKNGFEWMGRVSHKQAKNYQDPIDGRVYNTAFNETDAGFSLGIHRSWGYSHLSFSLFDDLQEIPDGSRDSASRKFTKQITEADTLRPIVSDQELNSYAIDVLHQHIQHYRAMLSNSFNLWEGQLIVNAGFERSIRQEFSHPEYPDMATHGDGRRKTVRSCHHSPTPKHALVPQLHTSKTECALYCRLLLCSRLSLLGSM